MRIKRDYREDVILMVPDLHIPYEHPDAPSKYQNYDEYFHSVLVCHYKIKIILQSNHLRDL